MASAETDRLRHVAAELARSLRLAKLKIVFAESCTSGLIAATLGELPGVSDVLCGSAVVYRDATKSSWIDVPEDQLADPEITAVSSQVAVAMAIGVLNKTPEADLSASVTGYVGPDSPEGMDGLIYLAIARRNFDGNVNCVDERRLQIDGDSEREARQRQVAAIVIEIATEAICASED